MNRPVDRLAQALADRYRIERELGEGGMATVYLARDVKHERDVAIKVLKPELGAVLGVERFLAEIRVTANLQHPNLLPLFDSGEADGLLFYVMPYIEGETLRARLEREKQLPVDEALRLAVSIAQALDYAHRRGVIHRDLKPENILLADGQPLVADFGIALAVSNAGGQRVTQTGLSLGTPQYMSPEQATGDRAVDGRTDIYSLGAMTYEMLTGEPPHGGTTAQAIIAKLMTEDVRPLMVLRRTVPQHVDAAVRHALEKLAADRFATAGEFALALQGKGSADSLARYLPPGGADGSVRMAAQTARPAWREVVAWSAAVAAAGALAWSVMRKPEPLETPVVRQNIDAPSGERLMTIGYPIAISPQGDRLAYVLAGATGYRTVVRKTSELGGEITLAPQSLRDMSFSPDGRWIAYSEGNEVRRIPSAGGASESIGSTGGPEVWGLDWALNDSIIVGSESGLLLMPVRGGRARKITDPASPLPANFPKLLPDGRSVFVRRGFSRGTSQFVTIDLTDGEPTEVGISGFTGFGVMAGHLVFQTTDNNLAAIPFDERTRRVTGDPITLESDVEGVGLSASGTLAFMPRARDVRLVLTDGGRDENLRDEALTYRWPRFSPDGRRVAVAVITREGPAIWSYDIAAKTFTRLVVMTTSGSPGAFGGLSTPGTPEWTADSRRVIYRNTADGQSSVLSIPVDGSAKPDTLYFGELSINEALLSPDGRWLILRSGPGGTTPRDIFAVDLQGDRSLTPIATGPASELMPRLSPDGRWLAYGTDESGRSEIFVRPFPDEGPRIQVSADGGAEPIWSRDGRTLYYRGPGGIVATSVTTGATFSIGGRRLVLPSTEAADATHPSYDVTPDGKRFLVLRAAANDTKAVVVHNWLRELRERVQGGPR